MIKYFGLIFILFFFTLVPITFAQDASFSAKTNQINYESINPDSLFYPFKRGFEKIWGILPFVDKKNFLKDQYNRRFKELEYIAKEKKLSQFEETTSRYITSIGELKNQEMDISDIKSNVSSYKEILKNLQGDFNNEFAYVNLLKQAEESTDQLQN